jgi:transglutaminase-like putative cysteine protease
VIFLAIVKTLTAKTNRDYFFVKVVAFLELLAASVLSTSPNYFLFLALFLVFGIATFSSSEIRRSSRGPDTVCRAGLRDFPARLAGFSLLIAIGVLAMTGGLFFILPRTYRAAFQRLAAVSGLVAPGFSNEVRLGQTGEIQQMDTPVMHIRIQGMNGQTDLKWRGGALGEFDGKRWFNSTNAGKFLRAQGGFVWLVDSRELWHPGRLISYDVALRSIDSSALFLAGIPQIVRLEGEGVIRTPAGAFRAALGASNVHYSAESYVTRDRLVTPEPEGLTLDGRNYYTLLPPFDPRILELARGLAAGKTTPEQRAWAIEDYLRRNFGYTLDMLPREVPDPLAHFLFERRQGHCEYFASAMAVMLRSIHIPARVATGFQSGVYNPVSGWHIVRSGDAHSWVEAFIDGRGWMTFDPTPPSAFQPRQSLLARLLFYGDAAETFWQEWVLNYDINRQLTLASRMEQSSRNLRFTWFENLGSRFAGWRKASVAFTRDWGALFSGFIVLALAVWRFGPGILRWWKTRQRVDRVRRGEAHASDATLLYGRMLKVLRKRGFEKPAWVTPAEFARQAPAPVDEFTYAYNELRYGGNRAVAARMVTLLEELEQKS